MERRRFGRSGYEASVAILGGSAFAGATPRQAQVCLEFALNRGVNRLDIAPNSGDAESVIGASMPAFRSHLFISGKSRRRNPSGMRRQLVDSLKYLRLDHFDLYQAHGVNSVRELGERGGAFEELLKARSSGLTTFVGITGHELGAPAAHLAALRRYDLDAVMFSIYPRAWAEADYRRDVKALLVECENRGIGVQVSRALARRPWADPDAQHIMEYEPQTARYAIQRAVNFVLSIDGVHGFCTPGDLSLLPLVLDAADSFIPMNSEQRAAVMTALWSEELIHSPEERAQETQTSEALSV